MGGNSHVVCGQTRNPSLPPPDVGAGGKPCAKRPAPTRQREDDDIIGSRHKKAALMVAPLHGPGNDNLAGFRSSEER
jgi:hypothetical protein